MYGDDQNGAWQDILDLAKVWPLRLPATSVLSEARTLTVAHSISIWDALLIAACSNAGVTRLYTEDMQHGATFLGVEIHNPFPQQ